MSWDRSPFPSSQKVFNHSYFVQPYSSIATQLCAPQITAQIAMVRMSINLCPFLPSTLGSSICARWSVIVILGLSFTVFGTFFFYFDNDFTIRASLVNLHIISPPYLSRCLVYMYHIYIGSPCTRDGLGVSYG